MTEPLSDQTQPPHAGDAEHGLINLALHSPAHFQRMLEAGINSSMFFDHHASHIFGMLQQLTSEGKESHPTQFNFTSRLKLLGLHDEVAYYNKVYEQVIHFDWYDRYLFRLTDAFKKREYIKLSQLIAEMGYDAHLPSAAIEVRLNETLEQMEQFGRVTDIMSGAAIEKRMRDYYTQASTLNGGSEWGIRGIDYATNGTRLGEFSMFKGEEGSGKSALLQQVAYHRASLDNPRPQLWITIGDMTTEQVINRIIQQQTGISSNNLNRAYFLDRHGIDHWEEVDGELTKLGGTPFYIIEGGELESRDLKRTIRRALRHEKCFDVYIDYLQQLTDAGDAYEATARISHNLLDCAHHLKDSDNNFQVSITAISAMNKDGKHFGAKRLAHDAENIFSLSLVEPERTPDSIVVDKQAKLKVEKQRNGPRNFDIDLWFEGRYTRFIDFEMRSGRR